MDKLQQTDKILKDKLQALKEQKRHDEIVGLISLMGENLVDEMKTAISDVTISVPEIKLPEIIIPKIDTPTIPEIKVPDITIPEIKTNGIEQAVFDAISSIEFPTPQVTVQPTTVNVPEPKVTVNVPEVKFPEQINYNVLPKYDFGSVEYKLEPPTEIWTLQKDGGIVATITMVYFDKEREELKSFDIKRYE